MTTPKRSALGRGLGALIPGAARERAIEPSPVSAPDPQATSELPIERIRPNPEQPRRRFDPAELERLADSIRRHGVLQPVVVRAVGDDAVVSVQNPVTLPPYSEPQPDLVLFAPRFISLAAGRPGARDVLLLIEVADSTLAYDRGVKRALYAREGIAEFWIVDVAARRIEVYRDPQGSEYAQRSTPGPGDEARIAALPGARIPVAEAFG